MCAFSPIHLSLILSLYLAIVKLNSHINKWNAGERKQLYSHQGIQLNKNKSRAIDTELKHECEGRHQSCTRSMAISTIGVVMRPFQLENTPKGLLSRVFQLGRRTPSGSAERAGILRGRTLLNSAHDLKLVYEQAFWWVSTVAQFFQGVFAACISWEVSSDQPVLSSILFVQQTVWTTVCL